MKTANQFLRFAIIGGTATVTHIITALALNEILGLPALTANFLAFTTAVLVSYWGNHSWTFSRQGQHDHYLPRFVVVALTGMVLNQIIVYTMVDLGHWSYRLALAIVVFMVPLITFTLNRLWVFEIPVAKSRLNRLP
ncbi:MAG TPA: GtrA family protein [Candidatus Competibacteraceae bacterium]|nr:GtrA family protein [Candidatus Competibacteraceae bacterium]